MDGRHSSHSTPAARTITHEWARNWITRALCLLLLAPASAALASADVPAVVKAFAMLGLIVSLCNPAWGLLAAAAMMPFVTLVQPASMGLAAILLAAAVILGAFMRLGPNAHPEMRWPALAILGVIITLSSSLAILRHWPDDREQLIASAQPGVIWLEGLALATIAARVGYGDRRRAMLPARVLIVSVGLVAVTSVVEWFRLATAASNSGANPWLTARVSPLLADPNAAGSWFALFGVAAVWLFVTSRRRWPWAPVVLLMMAALWLTGSRTALASALVAILGVWLVAHRPRLIAVMIAGTATTVAVALLVFAPPMRQPQAASGYAARVRLEMAKVALAVTATHPVAGIGIGNFQHESVQYISPELAASFPPAAAGENAHNNFLQILAELGVVGLVAFTWMLAAPLRAGWQTIRAGVATREGAALCAGLTAFLLTCLAGHPLLSPPVTLTFLLSLGLIQGLSASIFFRHVEG